MPGSVIIGCNKTVLECYFKCKTTLLCSIDILIYKEIISGEYKGKIMEQIVGQSLIARGVDKQIDLYYWAKKWLF